MCTCKNELEHFQKWLQTCIIYPEKVKVWVAIPFLIKPPGRVGVMGVWQDSAWRQGACP